MSIADMPSKSREQFSGFRSNFDQRLVCRSNLDPAPVVERKSVAAVEHGSTRQVKQEGLT